MDDILVMEYYSIMVQGKGTQDKVALWLPLGWCKVGMVPSNAQDE